MEKEPNIPNPSGELGDRVEAAGKGVIAAVSTVHTMASGLVDSLRDRYFHFLRGNPHIREETFRVLDSSRGSFVHNPAVDNTEGIINVVQASNILNGTPVVAFGDEAVDFFLAMSDGNFDIKYFMRRMKNVLPPEMHRRLWAEIGKIRQYYSGLKADIDKETETEREMTAKIAVLEARLKERGVDLIVTPAPADQAAGLMDREDDPAKTSDLQNFWSELRKKLPVALYRKLVRDMQIMKAYVEKAEGELLQLRQSIKGHEERIEKLEQELARLSTASNV